jgi:hypothetical protein
LIGLIKDWLMCLNVNRASNLVQHVSRKFFLDICQTTRRHNAQHYASYNHYQQQLRVSPKGQEVKFCIVLEACDVLEKEL